MIQFKLIDKRFTQSQLLDFFNENVEGLTKEVLRGMVDVIVENTPVDTGTYADSHHITQEGRQGGYGTASSHGKPRNQSETAYRESARSRLYGQIEGVTANTRETSITNDSVHASIVEYVEQGGVNKPRKLWAPYTKARAETNNIIAQARLRFEGTR